jgi:anti-anti-sigma regulatory factor
VPQLHTLPRRRGEPQARSYTTVRKHGGELKLVQVNKTVHDLLKMTKLDTLFEIHPDAQAAIRSSNW